MSNLKRYIQAEIKEIMNSMDEKSRKDPELVKKSAINWIRSNAERFRREWEDSKGKVCSEENSNSRNSVSNEVV